MDKFKRKLVGYVDDDTISLLEINNILGIGRGSKFSEWLRNKILEDFGNRNPLNIEQRMSDVQKEINELKIQQFKG